MGSNSMRLMILLGIAAAVGFFVGLLYGQHDGQSSQSVAATISSVVPESLEDGQPPINQAASNQATLQGSPSATSAGNSAESDSDDIQRAVEASTETIPVGLSFLATTNMGMLNTAEFDSVAALFSAWVANSDDPGQAIIDFLLSENDENQKEVLEYLVASGTALGTLEGLSESIIKELSIADPADYEKWRSMVNMVAINSSESRSELLSTLPNIADDKIVATALIAIRPGILPPAERAQLLSDISVYTQSESEEVRAAALVSLGQWSAHDYTHIVEGMLSDGSPQDRQAALFAVGGGQLWSEQIKSNTMTILNDESVDLDMRIDAFTALTRHALDPQSYADFYRFYEQHILPLEQSARPQ